MTPCANPAGCGHSKATHDPAAGTHPCTASGCDCSEWTLPACDLNNGGCGQPAKEHGRLDPHAYEGESSSIVCPAYVFPEGELRNTYEGGGGSFGGGGATGSW